MKTKIDWVQKFHDRFLDKLSEIPSYSTLSFSGGIESSAIFFGLVELGDPPLECVTFRVGNEDTRDTYYARKICKYYHVPLIVVDIPILTRTGLMDEVEQVIDVIGIARNIDIQSCHAYMHMIPYINTEYLVTGFYEDVHYEANKKLSIKYRKMKKGQLDPFYFQEYYKFGRECIYHGQTRTGKVHNYVVIEKYLNSKGIKLLTPFRDSELFDITQQLTFEDTNYHNGKFKKKWFITQVMFKEYFDRFGNDTNSNNMHTQGLKQYHQKVLLHNTPYKDTISVYNRIKNGQRSVLEKNSALTLF
jgi:hypothetical protein